MMHQSIHRIQNAFIVRVHYAKRHQVSFAKQIRPRKKLVDLQSKFTDIQLPEPPNQFKILCFVTCATIAVSSTIFLREKLLFGTAAGVTAKSLTAPFERLAVFRQASVDSHTPLRIVVRGIYTEEGMAGFWRCNGVNIFRASIQKGSLYAVQDSLCEYLTSGDREKLKENRMLSFISGLFAGLISTLITFPLDTIKVCIIIVLLNQATIHQKQWRAVHVWYSLAMQRGMLRGPWVAALPTCIGASVYYGIKFLVFDACIDRIGEMEDRYNYKMQRDVKNAMGGLLAGTVGNTLTFPNNCVRKRMQTAHVCSAIGEQSIFKPLGYIATAQQFWYHEGGSIRFYKGFGINLLRNAPNTAIQFMVYKRLKDLWSDNQHLD